ncbi:RidA family protein [Luteimonas sp. SJ-92]|uniref:RidA family protein n=1 Tax=Luteimonas salinisoli TaxID=2752307 RepID=A0A853JCE4_9GAMM|nr:RidA family protein [Luteimonas salinisoli]NZA26260.1 RidA family protein [Luteimonas salinisoli]
MSRHLFLVAALAAMSGCASTALQPERTCFHSMEQLEQDIGFCQAVRSGNTLHVSGVSAGGTMDSAVRSVYARLDEILEANGLSSANVVRETVFATDLDAFIENKSIRREFYGTSLPAASWVQVQRLYLPSYVVEVELTAEYAK